MGAREIAPTRLTMPLTSDTTTSRQAIIASRMPSVRKRPWSSGRKRSLRVISGFATGESELTRSSKSSLSAATRSVVSDKVISVFIAWR